MEHHKRAGSPARPTWLYNFQYLWRTLDAACKARRLSRAITIADRPAGMTYDCLPSKCFGCKARQFPKIQRHRPILILKDVIPG